MRFSRLWYAYVNPGKVLDLKLNDVYESIYLTAERRNAVPSGW